MSSGFAWAPLEQLRTRTSVKWRLYPDDVLPLWVAEMDVELAPAVREALNAAIGRGDTGYPFAEQYAQALSDFAARRWDWTGLRADHTALVPDVMLGITEVLRLITQPGDAVVVTPPVYPPFYAFPTSAGRRIVEAPLGPDGRLDLETLDAAMEHAASTSQQAVLLLSNPHNPTGAVHTREELQAVVAVAAAHRARIISDEIHGPLILPGARLTPLLSITEDAFVATSASKAWNLAGLKAGLIIAGEDSVSDLRRLPEEVRHGASHLGVIAQVAALTDTSGWLDDLLAALASNRTLLNDVVAHQLPQVSYTPAEGTYLAWLNCGGKDPSHLFLERARVALNAGQTFGTGGAGHVRLNFATSPQILTEAVQRMAAVSQ